VNLAVAQSRTGALDGTIESLREAIRLRPAWLRPRTELGGAFMAANRPEEAIRTFRECAALEPANPDPVWLLARALAVTGDGADAREALNRAIELAEARPGYPADRVELMRAELAELR